MFSEIHTRYVRLCVYISCGISECNHFKQSSIPLTDMSTGSLHRLFLREQKRGNRFSCAVAWQGIRGGAAFHDGKSLDVPGG